MLGIQEYYSLFLQLHRNNHRHRSNVLLQRPGIDHLIQQQMEDYSITQEAPLRIRIGSRTLYVGHFTLDNQHRFFALFGQLLGNIGAQSVLWQAAHDRDSLNAAWRGYQALLKDFHRLLRAAILNKTSSRWAGFGGRRFFLPKLSLRYFKRVMTQEKLLQLCLLIYLYNFASVKQNIPNMRVENKRKTSFGDLYSLLATEFHWSDAKIFATPVAKARLLAQRFAEKNYLPPKRHRHGIRPGIQRG